MSDPNRVPEPISKLIAVFDGHLPGVEFPGVSAASLRTQAETVDAAADALAAAELALKHARAEHAEAYRALETAATQGLGYARVFAADDEQLAEALADLELKPARGRKLPPKKRGRKPKAKPDNVAELPLAAKSEIGAAG